MIPKRGEKEFEPRSGGGTNLQLHVLDRSRNAMFDTLRATRTISKSVQRLILVWKDTDTDTQQGYQLRDLAS